MKFKVKDCVWIMVDNKPELRYISSIVTREINGYPPFIFYIFDEDNVEFHPSRVFKTLTELIQSILDSIETDVEIGTKKVTKTFKSYYF